MESDETFEIQTRRASGPLAGALQAGNSRAQAFAELLIEGLDGGEGWIDHRSASWWWYPSRLAVEIRYSDSETSAATVRVEICVVREAELNDELVRWLNDLNAHSLGWWWWVDLAKGEVYCTIQCQVEPHLWWWPLVMQQVLPHAVTVAEAMAPILADAGQGSVAEVSHPTRGVRSQADGWIFGTQLGPRDMSASLDPWISDTELSRMEQALTLVTGRNPDVVQAPLTVVLGSEDGYSRIVLRRHWHASWGWSWQLSTITGLRGTGAEARREGRLLATFMNQAQGLPGNSGNYFGGWVYDEEIGLIHQTVLSAQVIDMLTFSAGPTIGDVAALMVDATHRYADVEAIPHGDLPEGFVRTPITEDLHGQLKTLAYRHGPIGWSYELGRTPSQPDAWTTNAGDYQDQPAQRDIWNIPRHLPVCSFGIFNPMGPTVSSLEIGMKGTNSGIEWSLFEVMRHPHLPEIRCLGTSENLEDIDSLVLKWLSDQESDAHVLGGGPEWMDIWAHSESILKGVRKFAEADPQRDWRATADDLVNYALSPWARVSSREDRADSSFDANADPIDCWMNAITEYAVIVGQKLFMRSAWEGALAYRQSNWDASEAQRAADACRNNAQERLVAEFG